MIHGVKVLRPSQRLECARSDESRRRMRSMRNGVGETQTGEKSESPRVRARCQRRHTRTRRALVTAVNTKTETEVMVTA